ncbi:hypothetical protein M1N23_03750 [Dehalococcoidia bacterium]|nr:hypothetical protein [Dehalococcoidia bacterium]
MPSKKKRVASRQAQLSQRRRREHSRGGRGSVEPDPTAVPQTNQNDHDSRSGASEAVSPATLQESSPSRVQQSALPRQQARSQRKGSSALLKPVPNYPYLGSELKHVGLVTGVIVVLLIALTVVLR